MRHQSGASRYLVAALLLAGAVHGVAGPEKERAEVPEARSLSHNGVRYEAPLWGRARGLGQNGGLVAAIDEDSGRELWIVQIYAIAADDGKEGDKQDVFITQLVLEPDGRHLKVLDERGGKYCLDIETRVVSPACR